ncbi:hypothetical protein EYR40_009436 [Pleurotus pulmonarius]|nr:hypothetical protein EYR38_009463 [Pleurotus pulmonarius]KAF4590839.1 hypothetical protein EYR40_009436 [Pleurotus pulmonarius]
MAFNEFGEDTLASTPGDGLDSESPRRNAFELSGPLVGDEVDDHQSALLLQEHQQPDEYDEEAIMTPQMLPISRSTSSKITRTVAIIKTHALSHRFEVEARIQEAGFEIVKERQMVFDTETDPETLDELFGEDARSLAEGPVWVYVLERHRAVEVWTTLMGPRDPNIAAVQAPNSLRGLYGISLAQNGFMGSEDLEIAEIQIASLFASSPPFPTTDLPAGNERFDSIRSMTSSVLEAIRQNAADGDEYAASSVTQPSTAGGESRSTKSGTSRKTSRASSFRARDLPATHAEPDIKPRMSRASALRAGLPVEKTHVGPRAPLDKERLAKTFANVPGHKRAQTIQVASTAAPTIAPRMTRAASLRLGLTPPAPAARPRPSVAPSSKKSKDTVAEEKAVPKKDTFEGVPGHKRRESISVASAKPPSIAPRLNKSAALRQTKDAAPPSSFMFKGPSSQKYPGSRSNSVASFNDPHSRPASQSSVRGPVSRPSMSRPASTIAIRPPSATPKPTVRANGKVHEPLTTKAVNGAQKNDAAPEPAAAPVKRKPRPSSLAAPTITPRPNKSAMLRAAKMEAQNAAANAKAPRRKLGPAVA